MKQKINIAFVVLSLVLFFVRCEKPVTYPNTPQIEFTDFTLKDTIDLLDNPIKAGHLSFSFIDGDGDIGLRPGDTVSPYKGTYFYNLYLNMYARQNGTFSKVDLSLPLRYRIPYIEKEGQNKTLKGTISIDLIYNYPIQYDTIFYTFFIYDRALHKSNVDTTDTLILTQ